MRKLLPLLLVLGATGCNVEVPLTDLQPALVGEMKDPDALTSACGRPITQLEANKSGFSFTFEDLPAKRSFFGKEGKGTAKVTYRAPSGPPCVATIAFDFRDAGTMTQHGRRNTSYSSKLELTNVVVTR